MQVLGKQHYKKPKKKNIKGILKPKTTRNLQNKFRKRQSVPVLRKKYQQEISGSTSPSIKDNYGSDQDSDQNLYDQATIQTFSRQHYKKPKKKHVRGTLKPETTRNLLNKFKQRQKPKQVKRKSSNKNRCRICEIDFLDEKTLKKHINDSHRMGMRKPKRKLEANAKQSKAKYSRIN